jgi:hypothetical protein
VTAIVGGTSGNFSSFKLAASGVVDIDVFEEAACAKVVSTWCLRAGVGMCRSVVQVCTEKECNASNRSCCK